MKIVCKFTPELIGHFIVAERGKVQILDSTRCGLISLFAMTFATLRHEAGESANARCVHKHTLYYVQKRPSGRQQSFVDNFFMVAH